MSINQAIKQAARESDMYRFGGAWVVSVYDAKFGCHREAGQTNFYHARQMLRGWRIERAVELAGGDGLGWHCSVGGDWRDAVRDAIAKQECK